MTRLLSSRMYGFLACLYVCYACSTPSQTSAEPPDPAASRYFRIHVVDEQTGRGVPLVELETVADDLFVTDSAGMVAVDDPGLMGREVYFHVRSHGYEVPKDGFGLRGRRIELEPGGSVTVKITRLNVAERLYRVTGQGIYRDSVMLGDTPPIRQPLLNGNVVGQDSVVNALYHGKLYWFWGDTDQLGYALGNYRVTGAVSDLPGSGGLDPAVGVDLEYFTRPDGFTREMFPSNEPGVVWVFGLMVVDDHGEEKLVTHYARREGLGKLYEHGIGLWNDEKQAFEKAAEFPADAPLYPFAQPLPVEVDGERWFYFCNPYPVVRVRAKAADILDPTRYEAFTCYTPGSRGGADAKVERDSAGRPVWAWKPDTAAVKYARNLFDAAVRYDGTGPDGVYHLTDVETGRPIRGHGGSVFWNDYRKKWVMVALETFGKSMLGEVWYAEAATVLGPWVYARRIVTHNTYSFYNVKQHPYFDQEGGRLIYFEGTYTDFVSGAPRKTPRYDYNQMMYRLDLSDERLNLPVSIVQAPESVVRFYALPAEHQSSGTIAVPENNPRFLGLPLDTEKNPALVPLFEHRHADGRVIYAPEERGPGEGWTRGEQPLCLVWRSPRLDPQRQSEVSPQKPMGRE